MTRLTAAGLLAVWEGAARLPPGERALALLTGCGEPDAPALTTGDRDRRLAAVYRGLFGRTAVARADCPACSAPLELGLDLDPFGGPCPPAPEPVLVVEGCEVRWRPPTGADLAAASRFRNPAAGYEFLLGRCVEEVRRGDAPLARGEWPAGVGPAVGAAIGAADPLAAVEYALDCPTCGHRWVLGFDVGAFLWAELEFAAQRLVAEVHRLAAAYGWAEHDILNLSAARRAAYLRLCGG